LGRLPCRPEQAGGFRRVADEVAAQRPQDRVDPFLEEVADGRGFHGREVEAAGQRGERPAAIGVRRIAQVPGNQAQFLVAAAGVDQRVEQGGEGFHR